jgi:phosphatidylinositol alpha-1,6-mannosyltransferase
MESWRELSTIHRRAIETASLITSVSRYSRRRLLEWVGIDPIRVKVLPNTVDPRFRPGPKPDYLLDRFRARGKKVLLTVSRLAASEGYKGQDRVLQVLPRIRSRHPELLYVIVGDGDDRPRLEALAAALGVTEQVSFASSVTPEQLPDYFRLADVFVMPSTGEGFGIVFLEAMACGLEVIGGNRDGSVDPLADGMLGHSIDPENAVELTTAIETALDRQERPGGREKRFKYEAFADHLDALVRGNLLLKGPRVCSKE